ncbi:uncharacterized protein SCODWIG_03026 [Saccharomycodes ludwigii]|uniref:Uncharacterized protein n=1 Tax=Saccharomycodes ludwigii TaxID=36035 RepID=A0A376B9B4_9ASCO|nr:hypothetical protein SCDLUD_000876 [Saccharomycodes ludwigii]KAH3903255.1 hypothetical protein SCDLUD_000876 [Saccharomycodes ludwigii]SSD61265.1 uncharacterized protein SCODWIG_03026 [Saccharomycodes ludwigii]
MSSLIDYNPNSKQIKLTSDIKDIYGTNTDNTALEININQINELSNSLIHSTLALGKITPEPNAKSTTLIKGMFSKSIEALQKKKYEDALKFVTLSIDMMLKARSYYEAFAIQMQELQFMMKHKVDLTLALYSQKYAKNNTTAESSSTTDDGQDMLILCLQDLEMLCSLGLLADPQISLRKTDVYMKLGEFIKAKAEAERGLALVTDLLTSRKVANPAQIKDLSLKLKLLFVSAERAILKENGDL